MENNINEIKKKKRKLKPFVKVILFILFLAIIFFILYKKNFFSNTKNIFQKKYTDIKSGINNLIPNKNKDKDADIETSEATSSPESHFLSVFKKRLPSQDITLGSSTLMSNGDMKLFLKNTKNEIGYLFVNTKDNVEEVWTTFASVLTSGPLKSSLKDDIINLDYVDLRFKNKVFYKFNRSNDSASSSLNVSDSATTTTETATTSSTTNAN